MWGAQNHSQPGLSVDQVASIFEHLVVEGFWLSWFVQWVGLCNGVDQAMEERERERLGFGKEEENGSGRGKKSLGIAFEWTYFLSVEGEIDVLQ